MSSGLRRPALNTNISSSSSSCPQLAFPFFTGHGAGRLEIDVLTVSLLFRPYFSGSDNYLWTRTAHCPSFDGVFFFSLKPNCELIPVISLFMSWLFYPNVSSYSLHDQRLRESQDIGIYIKRADIT